MSIPTALTPWPAGHGRRIAGVSSFGFSGTNAHVIVEEFQESAEERGAGRPHHVLALSARSAGALEAIGAAMGSRLASADEPLADICFSANAGRRHFAHRLAVVAGSAAEMSRELPAALSRASHVTGTKIAFLFTGQGSQYAGMGRSLYDAEPVFREAIDQCEALLGDVLGAGRLASVLFSSAEGASIDDTRLAQPAIFAVEYALAELWRSWGVVPHAVMGHSVGEFAAAVVAGALSVDDAIRLIAARGRLMQALPAGGGMAAVMSDAERVGAELRPFAGRLEIAGLNGPAETVIAGDVPALDAALSRFRDLGVDARRLVVSHAFHSRLIEPMLDEFESLAANARYQAPAIPFVSNVSGSVTSSLTAAHWRHHARNRVEFEQGMRALGALGCTSFLEIGPHPTLTRLGQQCLPAPALSWVHSLRRGQDDGRQMATALGQLYTAGASIDWEAVDRPFVRRRVALPTYPFQRERFWVQSPARQGPVPAPGDAAQSAAASFVGRRLRSSVAKDVIYETVLGTRTLPDLDDHRVDGVAMAPAAIFVELALAAAERSGIENVELAEMAFHEPLRFTGDESRTVQTVLSGDGDDVELRIFSAPAGDDEGEWTCHVTARVRGGAGEVPLANADVSTAVEAAGREIAGAEHYETLADRGVELGPRFRAIDRLRVSKNAAVADLSVPDRSQRDRYHVHPALFDAMCHVLGAALLESGVGEDSYLLARIGRVRTFAPVVSGVRCVAWLDSRSAGLLRGSVDALSVDGRLLARCEGVEFRRFRAASAPLPADWLYDVTWKALGPIDVADSRVLAIPVERVAAAAATEVAERGAGSDGVAYGEALDALEALASAYVREALLHLGWRPEQEEVVEAGALRGRLGVVPRHAALFDRMLEILAMDGVLEGQGGHWTVRRTWEAGAAEALRAAIESNHPVAAPELALTVRCGAGLAGALRGETNSLELLFPGGSAALAERVYEHSGASRIFNPAIEKAIGALVAQAPGGRRLRVLEIGAGTGATTARVLPLLPAGRTHYLFTDVSPSFTSRARQKFIDYPFVEYGLLDVSRDPAGQAAPAQGFDLVIASNVLHATPDLRATLRHVRSLVAPGGLVLIVEAVRRLRWLDLTFGMTDGWWVGGREGLRTGHPLLDAGTWVNVLAETGFEASIAVPGPELAGSAWASQSLLMARAPVQAAAASQPGQRGTWLVLSDNGGVGAHVAALAAAAGATCVVATAGGSRPNGLTADPTNAADLDRLLDAVSASGAPLRGIVHAWNLDAPPNEALDVDSLNRAQRLGCTSVLLLVQAMARRALSARLWVVTRSAQAVNDGVASVAQAPVWGFGRVVALEHPGLWGGLIDLDSASTPDADAAAVWAGIDADDNEDQLAVRGGVRYGARLTRARVDTPEPMALRPDGSYLVTGGIGGVGLRVARWLAANGARHITLVSRRALPDRALWSSAERDREAIAGILEIERAGVTVALVSADVASEQQQTALAERFGADLPPLRGVLHLATTHGEAQIADMTPDALDAMLGPKVAGTWLLDRALRRHSPDFFVLFSSTTGLLGSKGLAHYAAANAFLDAFAHHRRQTGGPGVHVLSIDWGAWDVMQAGSADMERMFAHAGLRPMSSQKALRALGALLGLNRPRIVVVAADWGVLRSVFEARRRRPFLEELALPHEGRLTVDQKRNALAAQLASVRDEDRRDVLLAHVRAESAAVLALDPELVDVEQGLFEMGMDSLMSVELKSRLEKSVGKPLPTTLTFNYPSVSALTDFLARELFGGERPAASGPASGRGPSGARRLDRRSVGGAARAASGGKARAVPVGMEGTEFRDNV